MSLVDAWCPEPHVAALTATAWDARSGLSVTADAAGLVALFRPDGDGRRHQASSVVRAVASTTGGDRIAVGGDDGDVEVIDAATALVLARTTLRAAVTALAFTPDGLLALSADGRLSLLDAQGGTRVSDEDFGGASLDVDAAGRVLAFDSVGRPVLLDLATGRRVVLPAAPGEPRAARFVDGGRAVVLGSGGLLLVDLRGAVVARQEAERTSGLLALALSPDRRRVAAISANSCHVFEIDGLAHVESLRHDASPTGALRWDDGGIALGGVDGRLHRPGVAASLAGTTCVAGHGSWRAIAHGARVAVWRDHHRLRVLAPRIDGEPVDAAITEVAIDREGHVVALLPSGRPVQVHAADTGRHLFGAGDDTIDCRRMQVAVGVVAVLLEPVGLRWFDLRHNRTFELPWAHDVDVTGGGTWIAIVDADGRVHLLDPSSGEPVVTPIALPGDAPIRFVAFVDRRPELLAVDADDVLSRIDLLPAIRDGDAPRAQRIAAFPEVDAVWGLPDGRHAVVRTQQMDRTATLTRIDLDDGEIVATSTGLLPYVTVDPASGHALEPALGNGLIERDPDGAERVLLRSLPADAWIALGPDGPLAASGELPSRGRSLP